MANDVLVSLDPVTAERKVHRLPGGKEPYSDDPMTLGPHSLECDADGNIWITCAIGGKMAKFDVKTEEWTIVSSAPAPAKRGIYPHTLRIDQQGVVWYTDAGRGVFSLDPNNDNVRKYYKLPKEDQAVGQGVGESRGRTPYGIDVAPNGHIWYTKLNGNRVGPHQPGSCPTATSRSGTRRSAARAACTWPPTAWCGCPVAARACSPSSIPTTEKWTVYDLPNKENQFPYALNIHPKTGDIWICGTTNDSMFRFIPKHRGADRVSDAVARDLHARNRVRRGRQRLGLQLELAKPPHRTPAGIDHQITLDGTVDETDRQVAGRRSDQASRVTATQPARKCQSTLEGARWPCRLRSARKVIPARPTFAPQRRSVTTKFCLIPFEQRMTNFNRSGFAPRACLFTMLLAVSFGCGSQAPPTDTDATSSSSNLSDGTVAASDEGAQDDRGSDEPTAEPADLASSSASDAAQDESKQAAADQTHAATAGATLSGRVMLDGPKPAQREINMTKDPMCIKLHGDKPVFSEELLVGDDGGVQNVFVYIRRGAPKIDYPLPDEVVVLDQKDCMYHPRVQGMLVGQTLQRVQRRSGDAQCPFVSDSQSGVQLSASQPDSGPRERVFDSPEREIEIQCDIHPWMHAYLFVMDHPFFAVTDEQGNYSIAGLPAGEYSLGIWHEELGKQQQDVTVADKNVADFNFTFKP